MLGATPVGGHAQSRWRGRTGPARKDSVLMKAASSPAKKAMRVATTFTGITACAAGFAAAAPQAAEASTGGTAVIHNLFNKYCLSWFGYQGPIVENSCEGGEFQTWKIATFPGYIEIQDAQSPSWCIDGRLGTSGVTLQECNSDGTHTHWVELSPTGGAVPQYKEFENLFNEYCLDGRLGIGDLKVTQCNSDKPVSHYWWYASNVG
jgi:hypothetical protein